MRSRPTVWFCSVLFRLALVWFSLGEPWLLDFVVLCYTGILTHLFLSFFFFSIPSQALVTYIHTYR